jgi:hypothetical protein
MIRQFCDTYDRRDWEVLPYEIKSLLVDISKEYILHYHIGNERLGRHIVDNLEIKGKVTMARLAGRGKKWPDVPPGYKSINVTSGSANKEGGHKIKTLSPMFLGPVDKEIWPMIGDDTCLIFENYWQYSKIFLGMKHRQLDPDIPSGILTPAWYTWRKKGFAKTKGQRHPDGTKTDEVMYTDEKGRNWYRYRTAVSSYYGNERLGYLESRKRVYVPLYYRLMSTQPAFLALKEAVRLGANVQLLDFDAPEQTTEVTLELLKRSVNEVSPGGKPFGHGYIIAAALLGINPPDFTSN